MSGFAKSWQCVSEKVVVVRLKLKISREWIAFVQVYAPTDDCCKEVKDSFYGQLQ